MRPPSVVASLLAISCLLLTSAPVWAAEPSPAAPSQRAKPLPGDHMVRAGVGITVLGLFGYGLMAGGLGLGERAESDLLSLTDRDDIDARRDVLARGRLGNRLAIVGAITATASMAVGIPLIVLGRRRHEAYAAVLVGGMAGGGLGLRFRGRF